MRELRGLASLAKLWGLALVAVLAVPALAAPGTATLLVRGPLELEGPTAVAAEEAALLLRDPGTPDFGGVALTLRAELAEVSYLRIEQLCIDPPGLRPGVAHVGLPPLASKPSALASAQRAVRDALSLVGLPALMPQGTAAAPETLAETAERALEALTDAPPSPPPPASPGSPLPSPLEASCLTWHPSERREVLELRDVRLEVRPTDPFYTVLWDGVSSGADPGAGRHDGAREEGGRSIATLEARGLRADLLRYGEEVAVVAHDDREFWDLAPRARLGRGLVDHEAPAGRGALAGDSHALLYRSAAALSGLGGDGAPVTKVYRTGEHREPGPAQGQDRRVLEFLQLRLEGATGSYESPAAVRALGRASAATLDGVLRIPEARGSVDVGNRSVLLEGGRAALAGQLAFTLRAADRDEFPEARRGAMVLEMDGDVQRVESAGVREEFPVLARTAAAVSVFAVLAGLLAYFWPALKFAASPLYTRIAPDAVLLHGAREGIYKLIREEPGIHAHEVATRLGLGWGTAVYHLKLLERNGLVVSRHEGRYKRFFVTGDQRIQRKEAVALLRNPTSRSIASLVARQPGLIQKQLCQALGVSPSLASWHLQRLEQAGVVEAERLGRAVRYAPGAAWLELEALDRA